MRKLLKTKWHNRNLIKGINTWVVLLIGYSGSFLKWTREEFQQMDQRTRKYMTMHKALYLRDYIDRLYMSRREGLANIKDSIETSIRYLEDNAKKGQRKTDNSDQKQYKQQKNQRNNNKMKTKIGGKATVRTFQVITKQNLTRENSYMAKKGKT